MCSSSITASSAWFWHVSISAPLAVSQPNHVVSRAARSHVNPLPMIIPYELIGLSEIIPHPWFDG